jgi:hypothetical protein
MWKTSLKGSRVRPLLLSGCSRDEMWESSLWLLLESSESVSSASGYRGIELIVVLSAGGMRISE